MTRRLRFLLVIAVSLWPGLVLPGTGAALAVQPAECRLGDYQADTDYPLPRVARAIAAKHLSVLVVGAGSSSLPGPNGKKNAFPARLQLALAAKLPGVEVRVATDVKSRRTAGTMVKTLAASLTSAKPALMIWQTATVDAMLAVDPENFSAILGRGVAMARAAGADVIFVNPQYSPRTESMIALGTYVRIMGWVAVQHAVPVFDRFALMQAWSNEGTFDLTAATNKLDLAERVHDCLGRILADRVLDGAKASEPSTEGGR